MGNVFTNIIKSIFGKKSNEHVTRQNDTCDNDENKNYLDFDLIEKKQFIHLESAYQNQEFVFRRATENNRLVLGELLEPILKVNKSTLLSMAVAYRLGDFGDAVKECVIKNPEDIWNYDLFSCVLKNKTDEGHYTNGTFHETTLIVKTKEKNCIFVLTSLGGLDTIKYMRVSVLSPDNSKEDDKTGEVEETPGESETDNNSGSTGWLPWV